MKRTAFALALAAALPACSSAQLASPAGQLFCAIQTGGGGTVVVGLINAVVAGGAPAAAPLAIIATGASEDFVNKACAAAKGVPVSPPADPASAPKVAVIPPIA